MSNSPSPDAPRATIPIVVNGQPRDVPDGLSVRGLLEFLSVDPARVAVERNREIVPKTAWPATPLAPGDQLEVVWFVGGG